MYFNILIAEDDDSIRELICHNIERIFAKDYPSLNLKLVDVDNGKKAVEIAKEQKQEIILTDIVMPQMTGIEATKIIRTFDKTVPILALTTLDTSQEIDEIMNSGVSTYTKKPLNRKIFTAQIKMLVDFYLNRQLKYNKNTINLFTKNIFKRKTDFTIDREEDLMEFWEFLIQYFDKEYSNIPEILNIIYDLELGLLKNNSDNHIMLEENENHIYLTVYDINDYAFKYMEKLVSEVNDVDFENIKYNHNSISFILNKIPEVKEIEKEVITEDEQAIEKKEIPTVHLSAIRYSIAEYVSAVELLDELDPNIQDKIEMFFDTIDLLFITLYKFEDNSNDSKLLIKEIIQSFEKFNTILLNIGVFNTIANSFAQLIEFMKCLDYEIFNDTDKRILFSSVLQSVCGDIEKWINVIFIDKDTDNIHYFDASFADNCFTIENLFTEVESELADDDDDLEFF